MSTLIVAFPKLEEAKAVRNLLIHRGFDVAVPCTSGAQAINQADTLSDGIIICGYKLSDNMVYTELYEYKPKTHLQLLMSHLNHQTVQVLPINPVHQMIQAALIRQFHQIPTDYRHTTHPIRETELAAVQSWAIAA